MQTIQNGFQNTTYSIEIFKLMIELGKNVSLHVLSRKSINVFALKDDFTNFISMFQDFKIKLESDIIILNNLMNKTPEFCLSIKNTNELAKS